MGTGNHYFISSRSPGDCSVGDCDIGVSWRPDPDNPNNIYFELASKMPDHDTGFLALGWSADQAMVRMVKLWLSRFLPENGPFVVLKDFWNNSRSHW